MGPKVFEGFCGGEERGAVKCEGQRGLYLTCPLHLSVRRRRRRAVWSARVGARPVVAEAYMEDASDSTFIGIEISSRSLSRDLPAHLLH